MINSQSTFNKSFNSIFWLFGIVSFIGIAGYGLSYILKMPEISPNEFVPKTMIQLHLIDLDLVIY